MLALAFLLMCRGSETHSVEHAVHTSEKQRNLDLKW